MTKRSLQARVEGLENKVCFLKGIIDTRNREIVCLEAERDAAEQKIRDIKDVVDNTFAQTRVVR